MPTYTLHLGIFLHVVKLRHGTDGFTLPTKEGVLRIFFALKIRLLRPGANPRTWVPKASTLPLVHRSRQTSSKARVKLRYKVVFQDNNIAKEKVSVLTQYLFHCCDIQSSYPSLFLFLKAMLIFFLLQVTQCALFRDFKFKQFNKKDISNVI